MSARDHFTAGKNLIESNCDDSYRPSREALQTGISEIKSALRLGFESADAHRLLACAYDTLRSRFDPSESERNTMWKEELAAVRRAAVLDAHDIRSRLRVAAIAPSDEEKIDAYDSVLAIEPDHALALYASATLLIRAGELEKGLARMERAGEVITPRESLAFGGEILRVLREHGRQRRADELKPTIDARAKEFRE